MPRRRIRLKLEVKRQGTSFVLDHLGLVTFENLTKSSATELFDDLEAAFKNFLAFLKQWH